MEQYSGKIIKEWDYQGKHYQAKMYDDCFGYIITDFYDDNRKDNFKCIVGNAGYDYWFLERQIIPLAIRLHVYSEKVII